MVVLLTATISCTQAINVLYRIQKVVGLTEIQKNEIVQEIDKVVPFCPIAIKKD